MMTNQTNRSFKYLQTTADLQQAAVTLLSANWLAVDTEFVRESTYYPEPALVQISDGQEHFVIDITVIDDLSILKQILLNPNCLKVFHSAEQDLELFHQVLGGQLPAPLFDTQIAATVLGMADQISLANFIQTMLNIGMDKQHTRCNWLKRPLSQPELQYAADDVALLAPAYERTLAALHEKNRLHWLAEDFIELANPKRFTKTPSQIWKHCKGINRLDGTALATARALTEWRETTAIAANRPRKWVLKDDALHAIAQRQPHSKAELATIQTIPSKTIARYADTWLDLIATAQQHPAKSPGMPQPLTAAEEVLFKKYEKLVQQRAQELNLDSTILASKTILKGVITQPQHNRLQQGWRKHAVGDWLAEQLAESR